MGDPKKPRKKYSTPSHPWQQTRIIEENQLSKEYGLKNKVEIWKHKSMLSKITKQAKRLIALQGKQAEREKEQMFSRLARLGLLKAGGQIDDVLSLSVKDILERRLQTLAYRKGLARSMKQARQFIVHEHIAIGNKKIKSPSYLVSVAEENAISFAANSPLSSPDHPERFEKSVVGDTSINEIKEEVKNKEEGKEKDKEKNPVKKKEKGRKKEVKNEPAKG